MDEARYDELMAKRKTSGLSDSEANELGRLMAEKKGETYEAAPPTAAPDYLLPSSAFTSPTCPCS